MFKINPNPVFAALVSLTAPGDLSPGEVRFTFRHQGRKAFSDWVAAADGQTDADFLGAVVADWEGVADAEGQALAYSKEALARLIDAYPAAALEIFNAYRRELMESRIKN